jgi:putative peptidoglycan lipid II flippase
VSRGVVQVSAFIDAMIASLLPVGAVAVISNTQTLYLLPVSLFGMSVAAAELPELAAASGDTATRAEVLRSRIARGSERIAFFIVPSAAGFLALGHLVAAVFLQSGRFSLADSYWVWATLAGSTVGLLATALGRLLTSTYYALDDTRTPLRWALLRVALTLLLGLLAAVWLPGWFGWERRWGTAGLTASAGVAGWVEFLLLRRGLVARIGRFAIAPGVLPRLWLAAGLATGIAWGVHAVLVPHALHGFWHTAEAATVLLVFAAAYGALTVAFGIEMARALWAALGGRLTGGAR